MNGLLAAELENRFTDFRLCEVKFALFALHNFDGDITCIKRPGKRSTYSGSVQGGRPGNCFRVRAKCYLSVQNESDVHTASYKMDTGSFPVLKRPGRGVDYPPTFSTYVVGGLELYLCLTSVSA
jgi:hypothetical protein